MPEANLMDDFHCVQGTGGQTERDFLLSEMDDDAY